MIVIHVIFSSLNLFFIPIRFEAKVTDKRGRFKRPLNINIQAGPKYMEDPVLCYVKKIGKVDDKI